MQLHYQYFPAETDSLAETPPLVVLHGLFGSLNNWRNLCKLFTPHCAVYALDLRNHGQSPHSEQMDLALMAQDISTFMHDHGLEQIQLLGHSMGGKVAMQLALQTTQQASIQRLIVVDIAPKVYPPRHDDVFAAIATINQAIDHGDIASRKQAEQMIADILPDQATRLFLLSNLSRDSHGHYQWRGNMAAIQANYPAISAAPQGDSAFFDKPTLFIKGADSFYIEADDEVTIQQRFPQVQLLNIDNAGHWVHVEQTAAFTAAVHAFLSTTI